MEIQQIRRKAESGDPEAQYRLSQICLRNQDLDGMNRWLARSGAQEFPDALDALGNSFEKGIGNVRDYNKALEYYNRAMLTGSGQAAYRKAELLYKSQQGPAQEGLVCDLLMTAAEADYIPALRAVGYLTLLQNFHSDLAIDCMRRASVLGDPVSSFNLAWYLPRCSTDPEVKKESMWWLQRAEAAKYPFAAAVLAAKQGLSAAPPPSSEPITGKGVNFSLYPEAQNVARVAINQDPAITLYQQVLNIVDCAYLMFHSMPYLRRAEVIIPGSQKDKMVSDVRTSSSTFLPFENVDIIARHIELKIIRETGENLRTSEPMSILRYAPGEYYRPHVDYFDPKLNVSRELLKDGGQRTASAVTYLSVPSAGGSTSFPRLNLTVPPLPGATLWFRNCDADGQVDKRSLHAGETIERGEKWVMTKWFREKATPYLEY